MMIIFILRILLLLFANSTSQINLKRKKVEQRPINCFITIILPTVDLEQKIDKRPQKTEKKNKLMKFVTRHRRIRQYYKRAAQIT